MNDFATEEALLDTATYRRFGITSLIFAVAGLLWFVVCFSAKEARWWNSLWFFLLIFLFSVVSGIIGRRSIWGVLGVVFGGIGSLVVGFLLYVG
ncbi:MAG TPA: hypothetical protein VFG09_02165 [Thermodesulfovibrionales bacterium]|nr:hypothetical protein [Thermodesulfovibrionales bacterium]